MQGNRAHTYLGPIHHPEAIGQSTSPTLTERYPDFVQIAKGYGCGASSISQRADLVPGLEEMINYDGPYVLDIDVPYQEHVLPMIPTGRTVKDMITE
jgi:acetolactate synthase-1/2/3 large subunit